MQLLKDWLQKHWQKFHLLQQQHVKLSLSRLYHYGCPGRTKKILKIWEGSGGQGQKKRLKFGLITAAYWSSCLIPKHVHIVHPIPIWYPTNMSKLFMQENLGQVGAETTEFTIFSNRKRQKIWLQTWMVRENIIHVDEISLALYHNHNTTQLASLYPKSWFYHVSVFTCILACRGNKCH